MKRLVVSAVSLLGFPLSAQAEFTICSDRDRERVFGHFEVAIPNHDHLAFEEKMWSFSEFSGMFPSGHGSLEETPPHLLMVFQSPEASVAIEVRIDVEEDTADVKLWRTCIDDSAEDWFPYWIKLRAFMARNFPE